MLGWTSSSDEANGRNVETFYVKDVLGRCWL